MTHTIASASEYLAPAFVLGFSAVCIWIFYNLFVRRDDPTGFVEPGYETELMDHNEDYDHVMRLMRAFVGHPDTHRLAAVEEAMKDTGIRYTDLPSMLVFQFLAAERNLASTSPSSETS